MSSFSPYTIPQEPAKWVNPLDLNMVYKDISHKDDIAKQNLDELQQISTQLSSLPAFGADSEYLSQKLQKLKADMSGLNLAGLGDYNTISQIKGLIGNFKNDSEVLNIAQRGSFYKQELQKKKDYEEKGKTYVSPGLRKAEKYYGSGEYIKDLKFNQSGFVAPDDKELDLIAKNTPEWENIVTKGGYDVTQKGKAIDKLQANYLTHFTTNPQWSALLNDQFEQGLEGIDMNQLYNSGINGIKELFPYLPKEQQQEAFQDIQEAYQIQQNNPYATSALKDKLRDDFFKNQAYMAAQAKTYVNTTDKKVNEFSKIAVQHQNKLSEAIFEEKLDRGIDPRTNLPMVDAAGNQLQANTKPDELSVDERKHRNILEPIKRRGKITINDLRLLNPKENFEIFESNKTYNINYNNSKYQIKVPNGDILIRTIPEKYSKRDNKYFYDDMPISKEEFDKALGEPQLASEYIEQITNQNPLKNNNTNNQLIDAGI
jgi:hypothetical protein